MLSIIKNTNYILYFIILLIIITGIVNFNILNTILGRTLILLFIIMVSVENNLFGLIITIIILSTIYIINNYTIENMKGINEYSINDNNIVNTFNTFNTAPLLNTPNVELQGDESNTIPVVINNKNTENIIPNDTTDTHLMYSNY